MKKLLSCALISVVLGLSVVAQADTYVANTAKNQRGEEVDPGYGGYDATRITSTADEVICTGRCVLAGLIPSSGPTGALLFLYDTSVAGNESIARLKMTSPFFQVQTASALGLVPRPVRFTNGITARLSSGSGESVTVLFVDLDQR